MEGAALGAQRRLEMDVALAWRIENFGRTGKGFKDLPHYLKQLKPRRAQTAEDILEVFKEHQRRGAPMTIRLIQPGENDG